MAIETRAVLAGAYKGAAGRAALLTHAAVVVEGDVTAVLCGRVAPESLADEFAADTTAAPTCATCARRAAARS
jgi:hypothetical protein